MVTHDEKEELASFWDAEALTLSPPTIKTYHQLKADQICPTSTNETAPRTAQNLISFISSPSVDLTSSLDRLITLSETAATPEERAHALSIIDRLVQQDAEEKEIVRERSGTVQGFVCALSDIMNLVQSPMPESPDATSPLQRLISFAETVTTPAELSEVLASIKVLIEEESKERSLAKETKRQQWAWVVDESHIFLKAKGLVLAMAACIGLFALFLYIFSRADNW